MSPTLTHAHATRLATYLPHLSSSNYSSKLYTLWRGCINADPNLSSVDLDTITHETEPIQKVPDLSTTIYDGLTGTPAAVLDDTGPIILEIPIELFFDVVLPRPPILKYVPGVFASLKAGRSPYYIERGHRWAAFPKDPATADLHENTVYKQLEEICRAVLGAVEGLGLTEEPVTRFTNSPRYVPKGVWRDSTSKPDGFFVLRNRRAGGTPHWMDIVATGEYKRNAQGKRNLEDDSKKILWNMHQTMRDDPCRRFTFGFTIENREMRIWYVSRADIFVSAAFDFMRDPWFLIEFFLIFSFTDMYSLGWDPTMVCEWRGPKQQPHYVITVRSQETGEEAQFRATNVLSNIGVEPLRGRGTRVFTVRRLENGEEVGDEMALKDCWMDADRVCEGELLKEIIQDARNTGSEESVQILEEGLLSVFMHGVVNVNSEPDCTLTTEQRLELFAEADFFLVHRSDENKINLPKLLPRSFQARVVKGSHVSKSIREGRLSPTMFCPKKHYRIVFKEVFIPLYQETSLRKTFFILGKVCTVLKALHSIGWVHRDISIANILTLGDTVKLADVEYAKRIGKTTDGDREIRTGTADFMSIEVHAMKYKFQPLGPMTKVAAERPPHILDHDIMAARQSTAANPHTTTSSPIHWFYNPIHDMESIFWLMAYYILFRDVYLLKPSPCFKEESSAERVKRINAQFDYAQHLFLRRDHSIRSDLITVPNGLKAELEQLPLHPALLLLSACLLQARDAVHLAYQKAEKNLPIRLSDAPSLAENLYEEFRNILYEMRQCLVDKGAQDLQCRHLAVEYDLIKANEIARSEKNKKTNHIRIAKIRRAKADRRAEEWTRTHTVARPSLAVILEEAPMTFEETNGNAVRRSQRLATRVASPAGSTAEDLPTPDVAPRSTRKVAEKPAGKPASKKRKRADEEEACDTRPRRKVKATKAEPTRSSKVASRKPTRVAPPAPPVVATRASRSKARVAAKELSAPLGVGAATTLRSRKRLRDNAHAEVEPGGRVLRPRKR